MFPSLVFEGLVVFGECVGLAFFWTVFLVLSFKVTGECDRVVVVWESIWNQEILLGSTPCEGNCFRKWPANWVKSDKTATAVGSPFFPVCVKRVF